MKTVKEIEKETGINKQKIYREIRKNGLKPQKKINGINYFSDDVLVFFSAKNEMKSETETEKVKCDNDDNINGYVDFKLIQELKQEVKQLRKQIEIKDDQIETLSRLLDQQQKLSLADKKQIENHNRKDDEFSQTVSETVSKKSDEKADVSISSRENSFKKSFKTIFKRFIK